MRAQINTENNYIILAGYDLPSSIQEAAAQFANTVLASMNANAAETAGVEVMWFRATPDKRNQDVIFQSYTLYGVEDCPLTFKAMYSDTGYDDGAITYNIMGLNFAIPMTMDIALKTWETVTGNDGTIPQEHDIVFIPMTRKLMEVVSMTPVKQLGGQLTSYKVNLGIYKPTRSRIVGENLKESITNSTTNLDERFGEDIERTLKDIVDPDQLSIHTSDSQDEQKKVNPQREEGVMLKFKSIIDEDIIVDGHTVARSYYNLDQTSRVVVEYNREDNFTKEDNRCLSFWLRLHENSGDVVKNLKNISLETINGKYYLITTTGKNFKEGDDVLIKRGVITISGKIVGENRIQIDSTVAKKLAKMNPNWYTMPGFAMYKGDAVNIISGSTFSISVKGGCVLCIKDGDNECNIQFSSQMTEMRWYGLVVNYGEKFSVDVYSTEGNFKRIEHIEEIDNNVYSEVKTGKLMLTAGNADLTNIRLYTVYNKEIDKQIEDLLSYNAKNDSYAIVNDSADIYLNKEYVGRQH